MEKGFLLTILLFQITILIAQDLVQSGPMVGYSTMREAFLWVQTKKSSEVHFEYYNKRNRKQRFKTKTIRT